MAGAKPLILSNNWFDTVVQNPSNTVANSGGDDVAGHEYWRVADNLRDASWWTPVATNTARSLQLTYGSPATAVTPNVLVLDRGHNLAGVTVTLQGSNSPSFSSPVTVFSATIPSTPSGVITYANNGGLPTNTNGCTTADGVWWIEFVAPSAYAYWQFNIPALGSGIAPIVTGLYMGSYYRFPEYALVPSNLDYRRQLQYLRNVQSRSGIRIKSRPLIYSRLKLYIEMEDEDYIGTGSTGSFDAQVQSLLYLNAPWWFCQDDSDAVKSSLMRLYQAPGDMTHDPAPDPRHRGVNIELEEVYPRVYT